MITVIFKTGNRNFSLFAYLQKGYYQSSYNPYLLEFSWKIINFMFQIFVFIFNTIEKF